MQIYDCTIRLGGSLHNEVTKQGVTAAEVILLRAIHGDDTVRHIKARGSIDVTDAEERARLATFYSNGTPAMLNPDDMPGAQLVKEVFGVVGVPLPRKLADVEEDIVPDEPVVRRRVSRKAAEPVEEPAEADEE